MASEDKALLKAAIAEEMAADLAVAIANAEKNGIATAASRDTVERLFARVAGYKKRIDDAFVEGTFVEASREPVYAVFKDIASIVNDAHRTLVQVAAEQGPFASGLRKAHSMATERAVRERAAAARAVQVEAEEAAERAERARRQDAQPARSAEPETAAAPPGSTVEAPADPVPSVLPSEVVAAQDEANGSDAQAVTSETVAPPSEPGVAPPARLPRQRRARAVNAG